MFGFIHRDYYHGGCKSSNEESPKMDSGPVIGFTDEDVWNAHAMTHSAVRLFLRDTSDEHALETALTNIKTYRETVSDFWDYRDTTTNVTTSWNGSMIPVPSVNSHYGRQTIFWAIPLALSGQKLDIPNRILKLSPHPSLVDAKLPVLLPEFSGLVDFNTHRNGGCVEITHISGEIDYIRKKKLTLIINGKTYSNGNHHDLEDSVEAVQTYCQTPAQY